MAILSSSRTDFSLCRGLRSKSRFNRSWAADGMLSMYSGKLECFESVEAWMTVSLVDDFSGLSADTFVVVNTGNCKQF